MPNQQWPERWTWELEMTPHVLKRMVDRDFTECARAISLMGQHARSVMAVTVAFAKRAA
jgi:hypothetical protein